MPGRGRDAQGHPATEAAEAAARVRTFDEALTAMQGSKMKLAAGLLVAIAACSDSAEPTTTDIGACDGMLTVESNTSGDHVPMGSVIDWSNNPPTSGSHYPIWAAWDREYAELPRGYWVHNAEHCGIVLLYHCPDGCPDVVEQLRGVARGMAADSACASPITKRVIITSDPLLPDGVQVAAVSWNHAYTASCFDPYVETFAREHYRKAPEDLCADGANMGGTPIGN